MSAPTSATEFSKPQVTRPTHNVRLVTAASLFDGHDAAINVMRRIMQSQGAEVIHLGHDRSVDDVVKAAIEEDVQGVAISSYQGGHLEYFKYLVERLAAEGAGHVQVFGGGGGVIVADEIAELASVGVRIFSPQDGQRQGLPAMVNEVVVSCDRDIVDSVPTLEDLLSGRAGALSRAISAVESAAAPDATDGLLAEVSALVAAARDYAGQHRVPVLGVTGTGGSGKSSLTDELLLRLRRDQKDSIRVAMLAVDPTRRRGGGALLGDRIRMNSIASPAPITFRSVATRRAAGGLPSYLGDLLTLCKASGADLVVLETPGIGQGDSGLVDLCDVSLYVMTPEFGAATQLEKIDMLDFADAVAINKFERRGAADARRDVARQMVRNREAFGVDWSAMPVFGTSAARFGDDGVTALYQHLFGLLGERGLALGHGELPKVDTMVSTGLQAAIPTSRERYLADVATTVRGYHQHTAHQAAAARDRGHLVAARDLIGAGSAGSAVEAGSVQAAFAGALETAQAALTPATLDLVASWPNTVAAYSGDELTYRVRDRDFTMPLRRTTLAGTQFSRVALPRLNDDGDIVTFLRSENLPGQFPFTAGVFAFGRDDEAAARMFAGEGDPARTNRRFHLLSEGQPATRLSTAFDSVTLYGRDPAVAPDIYGKVGTSGVSVATLDDMKVLYSGFDLCDPTTSVSMTINGPAPTILAMFMCTALDQQLDMFSAEHGREPTDTERDELAARTFATVRGTVQADILKEDQGQNTCIFSTEFALRAMADIQEWFIEKQVRNFYSVSISGYHIAEAGANPLSQLAFTLANGFTYVETYLARGLAIDDFAPNLSFFFSNGMDAEYTVMGRVARRIWAVAMRERYGANERSQKLKYHVQTSGRSLHAQEMAFNDIRTTLQALCALYDNANSLHTNAYDEAVTTPSAESVRRALAIQLIIDQEWGLSGCENPLQGAAILDELTDLVEAAVLTEFDRISERGGVLGAMETGYQRGRIQDESLLYETRKHDGSLAIVGVNTFVNPAPEPEHSGAGLQLARATEVEKQSQLSRLADFQSRHADAAPAALAELSQSVASGGNIFAALMKAVRVASLGQITQAFFEVGGQYRRNV